MKNPQDYLILVVDDEEDIRMYLSTILEDAGFRVVTASSGREALKAVEKERPSFISLDLIMPGGSGIAFLHDLRRKTKWRNIPVMVVTGHARDELGRADLQNALEGKLLSGPHAYLEKPITAEKYVGLIFQTLGFEQPKASPSNKDETSMRQTILDRLQNASPDQLEDILRMLPDQKPKG